MRIWTLHPKYLDTKGLLGLWREGLLAKNVLLGKTKAYVNHPQLHRFKTSLKPLDTINYYLANVYQEAVRRGYNFNHTKIDFNFSVIHIQVTTGQIQYETKHLLEKLRARDKKRFDALLDETKVIIHPLFSEVNGAVEHWEVTK